MYAGIVIGLFQTMAAVGAGLFLGGTWQQSVGISLALYCLAPIVSKK